VEFFRNPNINFLGKKWYFIVFSLVFSTAGVLSMLFWHGIPLGIDFRGGTLVYVKYTHTPDDNAVRADMDRAGVHNVRIQAFGGTGSNEILIDLPVQETSEQALDRGKEQIIAALQKKCSCRETRPEQQQRSLRQFVFATERSTAPWDRRSAAVFTNCAEHRGLP
jgi:preprotein translocase subunit SecF